MQERLNKIANDTNFFLKKFLKKQKKTPLLKPMIYGLFSGGKKIRSKILIDVGKIFNVDYQKLIIIGAAVECIHSYSLIHDDLPCMDNDKMRRGKPSTHIKFGESTAVLAGNSLLTLAYEILSDECLKIDNSIKNNLIKNISKCSGHLGIAGGQYLDLYYEHKNISKIKIVEMEKKKTGKLFSFCCAAPLLIKKRNSKEINFFENIDDDLIDYRGNSLSAGKKTKKDKKQGKATLVSLLGHKNTIKFSQNLINMIKKRINKYGLKSNDLLNTLDYILNRNK